VDQGSSPMISQAAKYNSSRSLRNGTEIVELNFYGGWLRQLNYITDHRDEDEEDYKRLIVEECGYHEDEWWRIVDIDVAKPDIPVEDGLKLIVTLLNPGRCLEEGLEVSNSEWETFKSTRDKLKNGVRDTEPNSLQSEEPLETSPSLSAPEASVNIAESIELSKEK
jgi:hypothetical protein